MLSRLGSLRSVAARSLRAAAAPAARASVARCPTPAGSIVLRRHMSSDSDPRSEPREAMEYDVVIVGAGPSGLSAAIKMMQIAEAKGEEISVCVLEKGSEVGAHILSGNCFDPVALNELLPDWKNMDCPVATEVTNDAFYFLTESASIRLPTPPTMNNHGNYIISLSQLCRWLGAQAESMGVEIYCGFPGSEVLYDENGSVRGVATPDMGIKKDGTPGDGFTRGIELHAKQTIFAEGTRGSLTKQLFEKFNLRANCEPQTFGIGIKEVWEVKDDAWESGHVMHTIGWPMDMKTWAGSFMYHLNEKQVALGYVVGLDYENPYISPYQELQRLKHHPIFADVLEGGTCIQYGARALNEGGLQSVPKLSFPGGCLVGCTAGFLNVPKVKGTHTAMKSGMVAAEAVAVALADNRKEAYGYEPTLKNTWVFDELKKVRNIRPAFNKFGGLPGFIAYSGFDEYVLQMFKIDAPWTFKHHGTDHASLKPASECTPIDYPKPDGKLSFDILTNLARSGTNHNGDQPAHLKLTEQSVAVDHNLAKFDGPEGRYCPARVYEFVEEDNGDRKLVINAQNCLHCKTCDIKDPTQNINWTTPEGGGGPAYSIM